MQVRILSYSIIFFNFNLNQFRRYKDVKIDNQNDRGKNRNFEIKKLNIFFWIKFF